jgi:hypothetical protein
MKTTPAMHPIAPPARPVPATGGGSNARKNVQKRSRKKSAMKA